MNTFKVLLSTIIISAFLLGCSDESSIEPIYEATDEAPVELSEIEAIIAAASEPDGGMSNLRRGRSMVVLPAGFSDKLAGAIDAAGRRGIVVLRSGMHIESGTVEVPYGVRIVGEPGAILKVATSSSAAGVIDPALHILDADHTLIWGLEIKPSQSNKGGTAILIENSKHVVIAKNMITGHQFSIMIEQGDHARLWKNEIVTTSQAAVGIAKHGIVVINGDNVHIVGNTVRNSFFGVWACDTRGKYMFNKTEENYIGLILCKVPTDNYELPGGNKVGAEYSGNNWLVAKNQSMNNAAVGYIVIDGANNNTLIHNGASGNGTYDIELVGDSYRFGFLTPFSYENKVIAGKFQSISIKDCGTDNMVIGGQQVDLGGDPCY